MMNFDIQIYNHGEFSDLHEADILFGLDALTEEEINSKIEEQIRNFDNIKIGTKIYIDAFKTYKDLKNVFKIFYIEDNEDEFEVSVWFEGRTKI